MAHLAFSYIPWTFVLLVRTQAYVPTFASRRLGNVIVPCAQEEEISLVNKWLV